jgi:hypothetical protein
MATHRRALLDGPRSTFQVGTALGKTFSIWIANLIPFAIISLILFSPLYLWTYLKFRDTRVPDNFSTYGPLFLSFLLQQVAAGAMTYGVVQQMNGTRADVGTCISKGFARLVPVLLVTLLSGLAWGVLFALWFIVSFNTGMGPGISIVLFGVPALMLLCAWYVVVPVAVIENPGAVASIARSGGLTRGSRFGIFLVIVVLWILQVVINLVLTRTFGRGVNGLSETGQWIEMGISSLLTGTLGAVASAVVYNELRVSREGASVADIAKVFD